jgi:putative intracellular protease/amidase
MSASFTGTNPHRKKKVLLVAANPATSKTTGWPIGFWWSELTHSYCTFTEADYEVESRVVDQMFKPFAVRDGLLVTGQQQYSGAAAARLVVEALGR